LFLGAKLGARPLWNTLLRGVCSDMAIFALVADAKNNIAENFYRHHGFGSFPHQVIFSLTNLTDTT
jgi:hypothetical protein